MDDSSVLFLRVGVLEVPHCTSNSHTFSHSFSCFVVIDLVCVFLGHWLWSGSLSYQESILTHSSNGESCSGHSFVV